MDDVLKYFGVVSTLLIPFLLFVLNKKNEKLKIIQDKISDVKHQTYTEIYSIFFDLIMDIKGLKNVSEKKLIQTILNIKKRLLLFGSDDIIIKFFEWERTTRDSKLNVYEKTLIYLELLILIRKDISSEKTKITTDDILKSILTDDEEYLKFKLQSSLD